MFILWLVLLSPLLLLIMVLMSIYYILYQLVHIPLGIIMLRCGCSFTNKSTCDHLETGDRYTIISTAASTEEEKRFDIYVFPVVIFNVGTYVYKCLCHYFAGLFEANLIEDELIILWLHLWGTSKVHFVYEYDAVGMSICTQCEPLW